MSIEFPKVHILYLARRSKKYLTFMNPCIVILLLLPGAELPLVESFGLLNDLFPLPSILDAGYPVFDLHLADVLFDVILPSVLGSSLRLLVRGFQLNIFLTVLVSGILCTWPNQLSLWALMWLIIFLCFIGLSNFSLVLILHIWFFFVGPNILLRIFLSKIHSF